MPEATGAAKPAILVRPAHTSDLPQISKLGAEIFSISFGYSMPPSDLAAYLIDAYAPSAILSDFSNPDVDIVVACPEYSIETVIGFAQLRRGTADPCLAGIGQLIELQRLYVDPQFHGVGVGKKLIAAVEEMAREEGHEHLWLGVWEENVKAQGVYQRMGFDRRGAHDFTMGTCIQTDWIMVKKL